MTSVGAAGTVGAIAAPSAYWLKMFEELALKAELPEYVATIE